MIHKNPSKPVDLLIPMIERDFSPELVHQIYFHEVTTSRFFLIFFGHLFLHEDVSKIIPQNPIDVLLSS